MPTKGQLVGKQAYHTTDILREAMNKETHGIVNGKYSAVQSLLEPW